MADFIVRMSMAGDQRPSRHDFGITGQHILGGIILFEQQEIGQTIGFIQKFRQEKMERLAKRSFF